MAGNIFSRLEIYRAIRQCGSIFFNPQRGYQTCAACGMVTAIIVSSPLVMHLRLSPVILGALVLTTALSFLGLALLGKLITGEEKLVYYQCQIVTLASSAAVLKLFDQQLLPYLDIFIIGSGIVLCCARIGCFKVGCCHGKPHDWGVCYSRAHEDAGFTPYLVGVRLFPVQLLESLFLLLIVIAGTFLIISKSYVPGDALSWYIIIYGAGRYCIEFLRGDPDRPYFAGFSEAQWTSVILISLLAWMELCGRFPFHQWHMVMTGCVAVSMILIFFLRRFDLLIKDKILHPRHIKEICEAVITEPPCMEIDAVSVQCTSIGIQISGGKCVCEAGSVYHYTISHKKGTLDEKSAKIISRLIGRLRYPYKSIDSVMRSSGIFHLVIHF